MDSDDNSIPNRHRWWIVAAVATVIAVTAAGVGWYLRADRNANSSMTARAGQVMPFDLNRTTHTFTKTDTGGVETVVVNDPADTANLALIRSHLAEEAALFRTGNYSDPAKIHGMDMPGLHELEAGAARVNVTYVDIPTGGQIAYASNEAALVDALHAWFDRQVADHGMPGMGG